MRLIQILCISFIQNITKYKYNLFFPIHSILIILVIYAMSIRIKYLKRDKPNIIHLKSIEQKMYMSLQNRKRREVGELDKYSVQK